MVQSVSEIMISQFWTWISEETVKVVTFWAVLNIAPFWAVVWSALAYPSTHTSRSITTLTVAKENNRRDREVSTCAFDRGVYSYTVREVNWVKVAQGQSRGQCEEPEDDKVCSLRVSGDAQTCCSAGFRWLQKQTPALFVLTAAGLKANARVSLEDGAWSSLRPFTGRHETWTTRPGFKLHASI